jgi:multiple sugar transport system substrate-binding protein
MASTGDDLKAFGIAPQKYASLHPEVTVEIASIPQGGLTKVQAAIAAGDPPDMVQSWDRFNASGIYYQGGIQALDDYIKSDSDFDIKQLNPVSVAGCQTFDGKQFALPDQDYVVSNIFYNTAMFKEKGLDPAKPPETLDDLVRIGEMFDVKKGDQYERVGYHPLLFTDAQTYGFAFGGRFWDKEKGKITPDDPGAVAGLEWLLKRFQKYGVDTLRRIQAAYGQSQSAQNPFLAGQVAITAFWDAMSAYRNRYAPSVEYDQAWFPYGKAEAKGFGNMGFNPTWIAKDSKVKDVAWQLLKFNSMDLDSIVQTSILLGNTPHNLKGLTSPAAEKADPILRKSWEYAKNGKMNYFPPNIPSAAEFSQEWGRQVELILAGKQTIKEGVQKVIDVVQPLVDKGLKGG